MDLSALSSTSIYSNQPQLPSKKDLDKDAFMQLLVAQMQNQDPMEPKDNSEQISQLANFSSLEQMSQLNEGMLSLIVLQQGNAQIAQLAQGSALIGKEVTWDGPEGSGKGIVESIQVSDGLVVAEVDGQKVPLIDVIGVAGKNQDQDSAE